MTKEDLPPAAQRLVEGYLTQLLNAGVPAEELDLNQEFLIPDRNIDSEQGIIEYINAAWSFARDRARRMGAKL